MSRAPATSRTPVAARRADRRPADAWPPATMITSSGRAVDLLDPDPGSISIRDIANHLAKISRFSGATIVPYSVAQHSVLVSDIVFASTRDATAALAGLLHDAHEAYIGDVTRPMLAAIGPAADAWHAARRRLDLAIWRSIDRPPGPSDSHTMLVIRADTRALVTEARELLPETRAFDGYGVDPWPRLLKPLPWERAEAQFIERFQALDAAAPR